MCIYSVLFLICSVQPCDVGEPALGGSSWSDPMPSIDGEAVSLTTAAMRNQRAALFQFMFLFHSLLQALISFWGRIRELLSVQTKAKWNGGNVTTFSTFLRLWASVKPPVININFLLKSINKLGLFFPFANYSWHCIKTKKRGKRIKIAAPALLHAFCRMPLCVQECS